MDNINKSEEAEKIERVETHCPALQTSVAPRRLLHFESQCRESTRRFTASLRRFFRSARDKWTCGIYHIAFGALPRFFGCSRSAPRYNLIGRMAERHQSTMAFVFLAEFWCPENEFQ